MADMDFVLRPSGEIMHERNIYMEDAVEIPVVYRNQKDINLKNRFQVLGIRKEGVGIKDFYFINKEKEIFLKRIDPLDITDPIDSFIGLKSGDMVKFYINADGRLDCRLVITYENLKKSLECQEESERSSD